MTYISGVWSFFYQWHQVFHIQIFFKGYASSCSGEVSFSVCFLHLHQMLIFLFMWLLYCVMLSLFFWGSPLENNISSPIMQPSNLCLLMQLISIIFLIVNLMKIWFFFFFYFTAFRLIMLAYWSKNLVITVSSGEMYSAPMTTDLQAPVFWT